MVATALILGSVVAAGGTAFAASEASKGQKKAGQLSSNAQIAAAQLNRETAVEAQQFQRDVFNVGNAQNAPFLRQAFNRNRFSNASLALLANEFFNLPIQDNGAFAPEVAEAFGIEGGQPNFDFAFDVDGNIRFGLSPGDPRLQESAPGASLEAAPITDRHISLLRDAPGTHLQADLPEKFRAAGLTPTRILDALDRGQISPNDLSDDALQISADATGEGVGIAIQRLEQLRQRPLNLTDRTRGQVRAVGLEDDPQVTGSPELTSIFGDAAPRVSEEAFRRAGGGSQLGPTTAAGTPGPSLLDFGVRNRNVLTPLDQRAARQGLRILQNNFATGGSPTSGASALAAGELTAGIAAGASQRRFDNLLKLAGLGGAPGAGTGLQQGAVSLQPSINALGTAGANNIATAGLHLGQAASQAANLNAQGVIGATSAFANPLLFAGGGGFGGGSGAVGGGTGSLRQLPTGPLFA